MPHEQSVRTLFYRHGITTHRHAAPFLGLSIRCLAAERTSNKTIPKTPVEFDYDLWTTEDGKCMVRVKITGEVTEVDREVMRILRLEEKQMRRGFTSSDPDDAKPQTILSLDVVNEEDVEGPAWLIDPHDYIQESATKRWIIAFRKTLTANQREVFDEVILGGMSVRKFAKLKGCNHKSVLETKNAVCKKIKNNF